jgi:anti-anti-sigma regulatory factor
MKVTELNSEPRPGGDRSHSAVEPPTMLGTRECQLYITRVSVDLAGEFDAHDVERLCQVLDVLSHSREPACVNLSGVTFLDLGCARELASRSHPCGGCLTLHSPSWQAAASLRACGYGRWSSLPRPMVTPPMQISEVE